MIKLPKLPSSIQNGVKVFLNHYQQSNISDSAVVLAYYLLLSIFPILFIIGSVVSFAGVQPGDVLNALHPFLPSQINDTLQPIITDALSGGGKQLSVGIIITIWSASRAIAALKRTVDSAYGVTNHHGALITRMLSFVWMLMFFAGIIMTLVLFSLSNTLLLQHLHLTQITLHLIQEVRIPATVLTLFLIILLMYYLVPAAATKFKFVWPGALLVTGGLMLLSQGFSIYLQYFAKGFSTYKALGTFIVLMFWLYFVGLLVLAGAVLNASVQELRDGSLEPKAIRQRIDDRIKNSH